MGLDVMLVSKHIGEAQITYSNLSRQFCNFLCGPDVYARSEFEQIENITELDLELLRRYPVNMEPDIDDLEYQLFLAEEAQETSKIRAVTLAIENAKQAWRREFDAIDEGWIPVTALETLVKALIGKLKAQPQLHQTLQYNVDWGDYFEFKWRPEMVSLERFDKSFVEDLQALLEGLQKMAQNKVSLVAFYYG